MNLSVRSIARECLKITGTISIEKDILALRSLPPPRSLRHELIFVKTQRCVPSPPNAPSGLRITNVADRKISIAWTDKSDNEDGFLVQFSGKRAGEVDHTGSKTVGRNQSSITLEGLRSNYAYTVSALAFNSGGRSQESNEVQATTPSRTISVSREGTGTSAAFIVTGSGFSANSLVVIRATDPQLHQVQFQGTPGGDGKFVSKQDIPCASGIKITFTAFEDADPLGTFANAIVTTCP
jgi:hypothetical protein